MLGPNSRSAARLLRFCLPGGATAERTREGRVMIGKMLKMIAYTKAPKATFAVLHPRTTAQMARTRRDLKHGYAPRISAVGAALVALPLGYLAGRLMKRDRQTQVRVDLSAETRVDE